MNDNIWHLSIDDLLAPLPDKTRLGGPGPFVINLSVSTAPIDLPPKSFDAGRNIHAYQVQRTEDRRLRYRLRLGPFTNEDDADAVLTKVRDVYPGALTATADADDLRALAPLQAKADSQQSPAAAKLVDPIPTLNLAEPKPAAKAVEPAPLVLSLVEPAAPPPASKAPPPSKAAAPTNLVTPVKSATPATPPALPVLRDRVIAPPPAPSPTLPKAAVTSAAVDPNKHILSVESTQTVRALSLLELESEQASRWFVIQLSQSEEAFDSEALPNLDIFSVYRLYSVAGIDEGRIVHALRLGFFGEENAAAAVASYLSAYYAKPTVKRVSSAERDRFADHRFEPRKDVGATGKHAVIEITDERYIREKRSISSRTVSQNNK